MTKCSICGHIFSPHECINGECPKCKEDEIKSILDAHNASVENIRHTADSCEKARKLYNTRVKKDLEYIRYYLSVYASYFENTQELSKQAHELEQDFIELMHKGTLNFTLANATARSIGEDSPWQNPEKELY